MISKSIIISCQLQEVQYAYAELVNLTSCHIGIGNVQVAGNPVTLLDSRGPSSLAHAMHDCLSFGV